MHVCVHCIHACQVPYGVQKNVSDFLGVESQKVMSHDVGLVTWTRVLWRAANNLNYQAIFPDQVATLKKKLMASLTRTNNSCWKKNSNAYFFSKFTKLIMVMYKTFSMLSLCYYLINIINWRNEVITISTLIGNIISRPGWIQCICVLRIYHYLSIEMAYLHGRHKAK